MGRILSQIADAVEDGEIEEAAELTQDALNDGETPHDILNEGLLSGMAEVGKYFKAGEMFVPEVLQSAQALDAGMQLLKPLLNASDLSNKGRIVFCTVKGDLHDIGKKLCIMLLEGAGYEVIDIGVDVPKEEIVDAVKKESPDILAMSAMLTTTMGAMDEAVDALKAAGLTDVKVMIGGAPLSAEYATNLAVNYSEDAVASVDLADALMN